MSSPTQRTTEGTSGVIARYPDPERLSAAIERLSHRGVDGSHISLVDRDRTPGDRSMQRSSDGRATARIGRRFGLGALAGAVVGAVLGAIVVPALLTATAASFAAGAVTGAIAGAGLGALLGLQLNPTMATAWGDALGAARAGSTTLVVAADDDHAADDLADLLEGTGATEIRRSYDLDAAKADAA